MTRLLVLFLVGAALAPQSAWSQQQGPGCSCRSPLYNIIASSPTENDVVPRGAPPCRCGCRFPPQQQPRANTRPNPVSTLTGFVADSTKMHQTGPATNIPTPPAVFVPFKNQPSCDSALLSHIMTIPRKSPTDSSLTVISGSPSSTFYSSDSNDVDAISTVYSTKNSDSSSIAFSSDTGNTIDVNYSTLSSQNAPNSQFNAAPYDVSCSMPLMSQEMSSSQPSGQLHGLSHSSFTGTSQWVTDSPTQVQNQVTYSCSQPKVPPPVVSYPLSQNTPTSNIILPSENNLNSQQSNSVFQVFPSSTPMTSSTPQTIYFASQPPLIASCPATVFYPASPALSYNQPSLIVPATTSPALPSASYTFNTRPFQQKPPSTSSVFSEPKGPAASYTFNSGTSQQTPTTTNTVFSEPVTPGASCNFHSGPFQQAPSSTNAVFPESGGPGASYTFNSGSSQQPPPTTNTVFPEPVAPGASYSFNTGPFQQTPPSTNSVFLESRGPGATFTTNSGPFQQTPPTTNTVFLESRGPGASFTTNSGPFQQTPPTTNTVFPEPVVPGASFQQTPTTTNSVFPNLAPAAEPSNFDTSNSVTDLPLTYTLLTSSTKDGFKDEQNRDCSVPLPPVLV